MEQTDRRTHRTPARLVFADHVHSLIAGDGAPSSDQVEMSLLHHGFVEHSVSFNQNSHRYPDGWEGTMEYCRIKRVLLQAWSPLAQGALTGNLDGEPENIRKTAALVQEYARSHETTPEAILLAWLLKHPAKIQPVLGTTRPDRLRSCVKALSISLSRDEWYSFLPRPGEHPCLETTRISWP